MAAPELAPWINSAGEGGDRNSMQQFDGNGTQKSFDFNFAGGYLTVTDVKAYLYDLTSGSTTAVSPVVLTGPNTIFVNPAPTAVNPDRTSGQVLVVYRDTQKTVPLVDYTTGAVLNEQNLDTSNKQAVFIGAEMVDRFDSINASSADAIERSFTALTTANAAIAASAAATGTANAANATAANANAQAAAAVVTANNASSTANGIDGKAQSALDNSVAAVNTANTANTNANNAVTTANGVDAKASTALTNSNNAVATANAASANVGTAMQKSANLNDVADKPSARSNLSVYSKAEVIAGGTGVYDTRNVNGATSTSKQIVISNADYIRLVRADGSTLRANQSAGLLVDISVAGPAAGGRDQSAVLPAGSFATVWYVYNEGTSTLALVASASQTIPTLPPGYTAWARAGIWRIGGDGNLVSQRWHHKTAYYNYDAVVINGGVATGSSNTEILASPSPTVYVPQVAYEYTLRCLGQVTVGAGNPVNGSFYIRAFAGGFPQEFSVLDDNTGGSIVIGERREYVNMLLENTGYLSVAGVFAYGAAMNLYARIHTYSIP